MTDRRRSTGTDERGTPFNKPLREPKSDMPTPIPAITPEIKSVYSLIKERRIWQPPESVKPEISQFYRELRLPIFHGRLSLLLHGLDATPTPSPSPSSIRLFNTEGPALR